MNSEVKSMEKTGKSEKEQKRPWQTPVLQEADHTITGGGIFSVLDGPSLSMS